MTQYFIFAGEKSGDLHGGRLLRAFKSFNHSIEDFVGVGGPYMRSEGLECILQMEDFQVMGFSDVLFSLPQLWKQFHLVLETILNIQPNCVILIDYPGFNLRLAKALRRRGFKGKIVQYICPTVWAHGKNRIHTMTQTLDLLLTIYPFEPDYFKQTSLPVRYVGNPLTELIQYYNYDNEWHKKINLPLSSDLLAIFPGSRLSEIKSNLPEQLAAAYLMKKNQEKSQFAISYSQDSFLPLITQLIQKTPLKLNRDIYLVPHSFTYELMRDSHTALAKSGTITLELALHHRPSVIIYKLSPFNYWTAKYILRLQLPHYCMVNILGGKEIFPEFIHKTISSKHIYKELNLLHTNQDKRKKVITGCQEVQLKLENLETSQGALKAIMELMKC
jgi:lipid-A-disaccharide synthase